VSDLLRLLYTCMYCPGYSSPLGCPCSFSYPGRSLLLRSHWEAPVLSLPLVGPCSSNPLGCSCSLSSPRRSHVTPLPLGGSCYFSSLGRSLFLQPSGLFLFFLPGRPRPSNPLGMPLHILSPSLEGPCFSCIWDAPVFLLPWKTPVLSPPLEDPCFSFLLVCPCSFSSCTWPWLQFLKSHGLPQCSLAGSWFSTSCTALVSLLTGFYVASVVPTFWTELPFWSALMAPEPPLFLPPTPPTRLYP